MAAGKKPVTLDQLRAAVDSWRGDGPRAPRLADMAAFINANLPQYEARMESWGYTPQRKLRARISWYGKRREGKRLAVYPRGRVFDRAVYTHNPVEPYRHNSDVARWIVGQVDAAAKGAQP